MQINTINKVASKLADKNAPGWRGRRNQRKTLWHASKIILLPIALWVTGYLILQLALLIQSTFILPQNVPQTGLPVILFLVPLALPTFGLSFVITNLFLYCIPQARRAFEKEAENNETLSFWYTTMSLLKLNAKFFIPVGFGLSFIGLYLMVNHRW